MSVPSDKGWKTYEYGLTHEVTREKHHEIHTAPLGDLEPHEIGVGFGEFEQACSCRPAYEEINGVRIFTHNAFDGREIIEQAEAGTL